jgi:hypothetical protein
MDMDDSTDRNLLFTSEAENTALEPGDKQKAGIHVFLRRARSTPLRLVGECGQPSAPIRFRNASAASRLAGRFRVADLMARTSS